VVSWPVVAYGRKPTVSSVWGSNCTGIGVSVIATNRSPRRATLTFPLSVCAPPGANMLCTRRKIERQGSVANSP
jgi:hypothetical protein